MLTGKTCTHGSTEARISAAPLAARERSLRKRGALGAPQSPHQSGGARAIVQTPSPPEKTTTTQWRRGGRWYEQGARPGSPARRLRAAQRPRQKALPGPALPVRHAKHKCDVMQRARGGPGSLRGTAAATPDAAAAAEALPGLALPARHARKNKRRHVRGHGTALGRCGVRPGPLPTQRPRRERPQRLEASPRRGPQRPEVAHVEPASCPA